MKALEGLEQGESVHLQQVDDEVRSFGLFPSHLPVVGLKEFRQDTEKGRNSSDDEGEHNVENFMLC